MGRFTRTTFRRAGALVATGVTAVSVAAAAAPSAGAVTVSETVRVGAAKALAVDYRGNGHGHGMSQYGARGAARAGLNYRQILAFYYPGTSVLRMRHRLIRVRLAGTGPTLTIVAQSGITLTGVRGYLPTAHIARYRLVAGSGTSLTLQRLGAARGSVWTTVRTGLPDRAEFYRHGRVPLRIFRSDGSFTDYDGYARAVRAGGGVMTVDRVALDNYVAGVVPREMPASWERAALDAQAVAARTYAANALAGPSNAEYDICATTQCQVYGGRAHYARNGTLLWAQDPVPVTDTAYQILQYRGRPAFAQFSASNGGWTVAGGQPYLLARADPYDTPQRSFDPYIGAAETVPVATIARYFGLARLTSITITARDGHGTWKGRVLAGTVVGTTAKGVQKVARVSGYTLATVLGLGTTWFSVRPPAA